MMGLRSNGEAFLKLWEWAGSSGKMTGSTASQHIRACRLVLEALGKSPGDIDVLGVDVDWAIRKFRSDNSHLKESTLDTYEFVFRRAIPSFSSYLQDPASWEPPTKLRKSDEVSPPRPPVEAGESVSVLRIPLPTGRSVVLELPRDLTESEIGLLENIIPAYVRAHVKNVGEA